MSREHLARDGETYTVYADLKMESKEAEGIQFAHFSRFKKLNKVKLVNSKVGVVDVTQYLTSDSYSKVAMYISHEQFKYKMFKWKLDRIAYDKLLSALRQPARVPLACEVEDNVEDDFNAMKSKLNQLDNNEKESIRKNSGYDDPRAQNLSSFKSNILMRRKGIRHYDH